MSKFTFYYYLAFKLDYYLVFKIDYYLTIDLILELAILFDELAKLFVGFNNLFVPLTLIFPLGGLSLVLP